MATPIQIIIAFVVNSGWKITRIPNTRKSKPTNSNFPHDSIPAFLSSREAEILNIPSIITQTPTKIARIVTDIEGTRIRMSPKITFKPPSNRGKIFDFSPLDRPVIAEYSIIPPEMSAAIPKIIVIVFTT